MAETLPQLHAKQPCRGRFHWVTQRRKNVARSSNGLGGNSLNRELVEFIRLTGCIFELHRSLGSSDPPVLWDPRT